MLETVQKRIAKYLRNEEGLGFIRSEQVARKMAMAQVVEWLTARIEKQNRGKEEREREAAIRDAEWQTTDKNDVIAFSSAMLPPP